MSSVFQNKVIRNIATILTLLVVVIGGMSFTNISPVFAAPVAVTALAPEGTLQTNRPTFSWTIDANGKAVKYQLLLVKPDGTKWKEIYAVSKLTKGNGTYSINPGLTLVEGAYSWKVRYTNNGTTYSTWSSAKSFTIPYTLQKPSLLAPSGSINAQPTFSWNSSATATHYRLAVTGSAGTAFDGWISSSDLGCAEEGSVCSYALATTLVDGTYSWKVNAKSAPDGSTLFFSGWSTASSFSLADMNSEAARKATTTAAAPTTAPTAVPTQQSSFDTTVFKAGFESGNLSEFTTNSNGGFVYQRSGTYAVNTAKAHSGKYAAALSINTAASTGTHASYLFYWKDLPDNAYYYSAWYYIPTNVTPESWWIIWQWKSSADGNSSNSKPMYTLDVRNKNGVKRLHLTYRPDLETSKINYTQTTAEVPLGKWFHIEGYYKESQSNDGQVIIWQDGVKVFDVTGNPTNLSSYRLYYSVTNYTDSINPDPCTIYVDDIVISKNRLSTDALEEEPTTVPTTAPTAIPTTAPTIAPTTAPTVVKTTVVPTTAPTTVKTTAVPTTVPTTAPTTAPTAVPTTAPTTAPTVVKTTVAPTTAPTAVKTTAVPTTVPTTAPTAVPTTAPTTAPSTDTVFSAGFETGNISEFTTNSNGDFIYQRSGTYAVNTVQAHTGKYAAALSINTSASTGSHASYLFYWKDLPDNAYYYSAWYYIPTNVTPGDWWIIWQWKSTYDGNSDNSQPMYTVDVRNQNGVKRLHLTYRPNLDSKINYTQTIAEVPFGKWFHIEGYYKESQSSDGRVIIWQDGVKVFDITGNPTALSAYRLYFSVNNYAESISPSPCTIYVDDVVISKSRVGGD